MRLIFIQYLLCDEILYGILLKSLQNKTETHCRLNPPLTDAETKSRECSQEIPEQAEGCPCRNLSMTLQHTAGGVAIAHCMRILSAVKLPY